MLQADDALPSAVPFLAHPLRSPWNKQRRNAFERLAGVAIGVDWNEVAVLAAEQLPQRHAMSLADRVQQRRLNSADRVHHHSGRGMDAARFNAAENAIDRGWVLANENLAEIANR